MSSPRVWFITGTTSGFGRALTELALSKGEIVVATARRPSVLDNLKAQHTASQLLVVNLDVTEPNAIVAAFAQATKAFGRVDVVVNNAGWGALGEVESIRDADARAMFEANFWGAANVSREAVRVFREVNEPVGGRLLQISSMTGISGNASWSYYSASKFALEGLTESLFHDLDPAWNIKVTIIEPGGFRTEGHGKVIWSPAHPAYSNPDLPISHIRKLVGNFTPSGDVQKAVRAIYDVAGLPEPPLHLPLGKDAVALARQKITSLTVDADKYEYFSTDLEVDE
ncbi:NAD-P-binding protein [Trametes maxima]|nr:NAD-P-binding protein [Trametes maxima]